MADETPKINIVSQISEDKQKEIVNEIIDETRLDLDSRSDWEEKRDKWYKLWACDRAPKNDPWPGASNICLPMLATASNQFHSRVYQALFSPPELVKTIPVAENDLRRAENVQDFLNWQLMYDVEEYEDVFDRLLQLLPINGMHIKKIMYNSKLERPATSHISPMDIVLPYRTLTLETARRITHRIFLHYDEMADRNDEGLYYKKNFEKIPKAEKGVVDLDSPTKDTSDENEGITDIQHDLPREIYECHKRYDLGDKRKPYIFTVDKLQQTLLRVTKREYTRGSETITLNHFIDYHFIPNPEGFYSFGFGHFLEQLNEMANTAFNQIFDSGSMSNMPFGFYGRRAGIKSRKIKLRPGLMTEVEDAKNIYFPSLQRVDSVLFQLLGVIQQYTEQFTSVTELLSGRQQKGVREPTVGATNAVIEQGLMSFSVIAKRVFRSFRKELRLIMALNQIHLPDKKEYRVMGDEDKIAFPDMKREDFAGVKDVLPIGDPSFASRGMKRQEAMEIYQILMENPLVVGNPETGEGANQRAIYEITSDLLDTYNKKNKNKLLPPIPEDPIEPGEENAMFMQGDSVDPKPGEDHRFHDEVHAGFEGSQFYGAMPDDYKVIHAKHRFKTQQLFVVEQGQAQQVGA